MITCPYLTIEFKKSAEQARVQAPAAASVALYNRFLLKNKALDITKTNGQTLKRIKCGTTSFTFVGSKVTVWILEAYLDGDGDLWNGCSMSVLWQGNCTSESVVRQLKKWINEIHRRGLSQHATDGQQDAKNILQGDDVDISLDDVKKTG